MGAVLEKAGCFVTRKFVFPKQLLVILHPTAGLQIPSGTVEIGEMPEDAVRRELHEETGLLHKGSITQLETLDTVLTDERKFIVSPSLVSARTLEQNSVEFKFRRGLPVRIVSRKDSLHEVAYEEFDYNMDPPKLINSWTGFVPSGTCADILRRYLFHIELESSEDTWAYEADGQRWNLAWRPLDDVRLFGEQNAWFEVLKYKFV